MSSWTLFSSKEKIASIIRSSQLLIQETGKSLHIVITVKCPSKKSPGFWEQILRHCGQIRILQQKWCHIYLLHKTRIHSVIHLQPVQQGYRACSQKAARCTPSVGRRRQLLCALQWLPGSCAAVVAEGKSPAGQGDHPAYLPLMTLPSTGAAVQKWNVSMTY